MNLKTYFALTAFLGLTSAPLYASDASQDIAQDPNLAPATTPVDMTPAADPVTPASPVVAPAADQAPADDENADNLDGVATVDNGGDIATDPADDSSSSSDEDDVVMAPVMDAGDGVVDNASADDNADQAGDVILDMGAGDQAGQADAILASAIDDDSGSSRSESDVDVADTAAEVVIDDGNASSNDQGSSSSEE